MQPRLLPVLVVAALAAAGCVAPGLGQEPAPAAPDASALPFPTLMGADHDHQDVALHAHAYNFVQTDHHPLAGSPTHASGAHALDLKAGHLFAAVYGGDADAEGGFFVFDAADPAHPKEVGRFRFAGPMGGDRSMEANEDATFVVLGTEAVTCAGHVNPVAPGMYLIDVRDKSDPRIVDHRPATGVHSVTIHRIDGKDYVFTVQARQNVFLIDTSLPSPRLVPVAELPIGHDSVVVDDPILGKPLLFASNGDGGLEVWDVSDPSAPKNLAGWNIPNRDDRYYVHTGHVTYLDGRRIVVVTSEDWGDYPSALWVLDATDLEYIETLSSWRAPGDHPAEGLRYSMHNPRFFEDKLLVTYYHGGLWALDVATPELRAAPQVVGQFTPGESNGWTPQKPKTSAFADHRCGVFHLDDAPVVFDVEAGDGVVYVADLPTGLYTLKPAW